jgi:hypothetical protein
MQFLFDERCLRTHDLPSLIANWIEVVDSAAECNPRIPILIDGYAIRDGAFLARMSRLPNGLKQLFIATFFAAEPQRSWRPGVHPPESRCKLETEDDAVLDCAICELHERRKMLDRMALQGSLESTYRGRTTIGVARADALPDVLVVDCATDLASFLRIADLWECRPPQYDLAATRSPRDWETALNLDPDRFERLSRFERRGRRRVFREMQTGRLFYVDNLHIGPAAHLEVFDANGIHLGTADLQGALRPDTAIEGRTIAW